MSYPKGMFGLKTGGPRNPRTVVPTTRDLAWAAGIYEGEGCYYHRDLPANLDSVSVGQSGSDWLPRRMRDLFGGSVREIKSKPGTQRKWVWVTSGPHARGFLLTMYTFLSPRRQQKIREGIRGIA